jgi:hypothetical protein
MPAKSYKMNLVSTRISPPANSKPGKLPTKNIKARTLKAQAADEIEM